ncbi:hypothetical protein KA183_05470 [bacterium]|nr:hypothetical protein [bacterium]
MRKKCPVLLLLACILIFGKASAFEKNVSWIFVRNDNAKVYSQGHHKYSCGYVALLNNLSFGNQESQAAVSSIEGITDDDKMSALEKLFNDKTSIEYSKGGRMRDVGISSADLLQICNEFRLDHNLQPLKGICLDRLKNESKIEMGTRIHSLLLTSIEKGESPIIMVRSESAHFKPMWYQSAASVFGVTSAFEKASKWDGLQGHYLTVIGIPAKVNDDGSFCLDYIDPAKGKKRQLFVYPEVRNFVAPKGVDKNLKWIGSFPYLAVAASTLNLNTKEEKWNERTIVFLYNAIYSE